MPIRSMESGRARRRGLVALVALVGLAVAPGGGGVGLAQGVLDGVSMNPIIINGQLRHAIALLHEALASLRAGAVSGEELSRVDRVIVRSYSQLNVAVAGVDHLLRVRKYPDPMLQQAKTLIDRARDLGRAAHAQVQGAAAFEAERPRQVEAAIRIVDQMIALVGQATEWL